MAVGSFLAMALYLCFHFFTNRSHVNKLCVTADRAFHHCLGDNLLARKFNFREVALQMLEFKAGLSLK
jgi:hypothetical protein